MLPVSQVSKEDERRWRELSSRALEPNPFLEPDSLLPVADHFPTAATGHLVVASEDSRFLGCIYIRSSRLLGNIQRSAVTTRPTDEGVPPLPIVGTPLVSTDRPEATVCALLRQLRTSAQRHYPGIVQIDRVEEDGPVAALLRKAAGSLNLPISTSTTWDRGVVRLAETTPPLEIFGKKTLSEAARRGRRLADLLGEPIKLVDLSSDRAAADQFGGLEAAGWKGAAGTALLSRKDHYECVRDVYDRYRTAGRLGIVALESAGRKVAMLSYVRTRQNVAVLRVAYDEQFSRYSPGIQLWVELTRYLHASGAVSRIDIPHGPSFRDFYVGLFHDRVRVSTLLLGVGGRLDRALVNPPTILRIVGRGMRLGRKGVDGTRKALRYSQTKA